jgi:hypothetical protein
MYIRSLEMTIECNFMTSRSYTTTCNNITIAQESSWRFLCHSWSIRGLFLYSDGLASSWGRLHGSFGSWSSGSGNCNNENSSSGSGSCDSNWIYSIFKELKQELNKRTTRKYSSKRWLQSVEVLWWLPSLYIWLYMPRIIRCHHEAIWVDFIYKV